MSLKQKLLELKRFRVLTNIESSITKGEKITRKDYVETVKLPDVVALLDEATKDLMLKCKISECINWEEGDCGYGLAYRLKYCKEYKAVLVGGEKK